MSGKEFFSPPINFCTGMTPAWWMKPNQTKPSTFIPYHAVSKGRYPKNLYLNRQINSLQDVRTRKKCVMCTFWIFWNLTLNFFIIKHTPLTRHTFHLPLTSTRPFPRPSLAPPPPHHTNGFHKLTEADLISVF